MEETRERERRRSRKEKKKLSKRFVALAAAAAIERVLSFFVSDSLLSRRDRNSISSFKEQEEKKL